MSNSNCFNYQVLKPITFNQLYIDYHVMVYNVVLHYLQNLEDAEEVTQDVFIKVNQSIHTFREESTIKTWIYRITINQSIDFIKKKNSKKRFFSFGRKTDNELEYINTSSFEHPGILLENKENAKILFEVINTLPENQKTAFILAKVDGLSNPEVSEVMEMSISAVESLIFRAKSTLKEKLSSKFEEYRKKK